MRTPPVCLSPVCLSIAGFDPSSGAGATLDMRVFESLGCYPTSVLTAITAQNTLGVASVSALSETLVCEQLRSLIEDMPPAAVKIGMLGNARIAEALAAILEKLSCPIVLDPVLKSSSGTTLTTLEPQQCTEFASRCCSLITPNILEAQHFLQRRIEGKAEAQQAAVDLQKLLGCRVLVTGGHVRGASEQEAVVDFYADIQGVIELPSQRIPNAENIHGTGCAVSAAIAAYLAKGFEPLEAIRSAKAWLPQQLAAAQSLGKGAKIFSTVRA